MNHEDQLREFGDRLEIKTGTPGGVTYILDGKPKCLRRKMGGGFCQMGAGRATDHYGMGACSKHGGNAGRPPTTGRRSEMANRRFQEAYERMLNSNLLDLTPTVAVAKVLLEDLLEKYYAADELEQQAILAGLMIKNIAEVGNTVHKIKKIEQQGVLTAASAKLMMIRAVETMRKLLREWEDDERQVEIKFNEFLLAWRTEVEEPLGLTTTN